VVHVSRTEISIARFLIAFFAGENEEGKPHVFRAVYPFGFMCCRLQWKCFTLSL
jgi:hypothetical protein